MENRWKSGKYAITTLTGHRASVFAIKYDATKLISAGEDSTLKIWNVKSGQASTTIRSSSQPRCFVNCGIAEGKKMIAVGCDDGTIKIFSSLGGAPKKTLKEHNARITTLQYSEDLNMLISGSEDSKIKMWDLKSNSCISTIDGHSGKVNCIAQKDSTDFFVSCGDDLFISLWKMKDGSFIKKIEEKSPVLALDIFYNEDTSNSIICLFEKELKIFSANSLEIEKVIQVAPTLSNISMHIDTLKILIGLSDGSILLYYNWMEIENEEVTSPTLVSRTFKDHESSVFGIQADDDKMISCSKDGTIKIWDLNPNLPMSKRATKARNENAKGRKKYVIEEEKENKHASENTALLSNKSKKAKKENSTSSGCCTIV